MLGPFHHDTAKPLANLECTRCRDRHQRGGERGSELLEDRLPETRRHTARNNLDNSTQRITISTGLVDRRDHPIGRC